MGRDISTVRRLSFYHSKCANCWVTAPIGAWGEAWRGALACSPSLPSTPFVADVVSKWLLLTLRLYHYKSLLRLLVKIVWLGRPAVSVGSFLAGPRLWLNQGPFRPSRTPFAVFRSFLEAISASFQGRRPRPVFPSPPVRTFSDAAHDRHFQGRYVVGLWSPNGPSVQRVPVWVDNQHAAELYGALAALDLVRRYRRP